MRLLEPELEKGSTGENLDLDPEASPFLSEEGKV